MQHSGSFANRNISTEFQHEKTALPATRLLPPRNKSFHLTNHVALVSQEDVMTRIWHTDDMRGRHAIFKIFRHPLFRLLR